MGCTRFKLWWCEFSFHFLFPFRNPCIQLLYGFILTGGTAIYTFKVIPYFDKLNAFSIVEYILIAVNVTLFWVCCVRDPGIISALNHSEYMNDYEPDGFYYTAQECYTCKLVKPARSKHCCKYTDRQQIIKNNWETEHYWCGKKVRSYSITTMVKHYYCANPKPVSTLIQFWNFNYAMTNQIRDKKPQARNLITVNLLQLAVFFILHLIGFFFTTQL